MEPKDILTTQQFVVDRLHDIQRKAETSKFTDALVAIKEVKTADSKNIYVIAIEKQIAKLCDSSLPEENRSGIVRSLPSMIDRAISDIQRRASVPKVDESQREQKEAALEKLKSQYFQRADDYIEKHEYQRALEEIRRIYIIEPGSAVAKEYEQKIEQLAALHARNEAEATISAELKKTKTNVKEPKVEVRKQKKTDPIIELPQEKVVLQPEENLKKSKLPTLIAAVADPIIEPLKEKVVLQPEENLKKSKLPILVAAVVVILAIGAWLFFSRNSSSGTQTNQQQTQQLSPMQDSVIIPSPTTTSTPQSRKGSAPIAETSKQSVKVEKKKPEELVPQEQRPVQPVVPPPQATTQSTNTKPQAGQPPAAAPTQPTQQPTTTESAPAPMPFVAIESPPDIIKRVLPVYPDIAIKMGIQGRVTVEVTVDAQGKPIQTKVVKSSSDVFNDAAIEAVMKYTFKPAMQSTGPVTAKMYIPIDFHLK